MADTAISNPYYNGVIVLTKIAFAIIAVSIMVIFGYTAIQDKFEQLKANYATKSIDPTTTASAREKQLDCLAQNIYWEAAGESFEGKVAVAQVTVNRAESKKFPNDICKVVYQKNKVYETLICQFSWACEGKPPIKVVHPTLYKESEEVAKKVLLENFRLPGLTTAMYYHNTSVKPGWKKKKIGQIGNHIFYEG